MKAAAAGILLAVAASFLAEAALAQSPSAQSAYRDKRWEFTLQMRGVEGKGYSFEGGSAAETKDALGFGLGVSYNVNPHLNLGGEFLWVSQDYTSTTLGNGPGGSYTGRGSVDIGSFMFNATWHILSGPVTPYLSGGIGSTTVDSNIPSGPPGNYCWYYPWWGYYCGTYVPTATQTSFSYNAGAGVRWDFSRDMFMRFGAQQQWTDFSGTTENYPSNTVWRLELGFKN